MSAKVVIDFPIINWLHANVLCAWKEKGAPKKRRVVATKLFYHEEAPDYFGGSLELCMTWKCILGGTVRTFDCPAVCWFFDTGKNLKTMEVRTELRNLSFRQVFSIGPKISPQRIMENEHLRRRSFAFKQKGSAKRKNANNECGKAILVSIDKSEPFG